MENIRTMKVTMMTRLMEWNKYQQEEGKD